MIGLVSAWLKGYVKKIKGSRFIELIAETPAGSPFVPSRPPVRMMAAKSSFLPP